MKRITSTEVINKGLDWVRTLDEFEIEGNHYHPYPNMLAGLWGEYKIDTEYFGNSDHGSSISKFTRKCSEEIVNEKIGAIVAEFAERYHLTIFDWGIKDMYKLREVLGL